MRKSDQAPDAPAADDTPPATPATPTPPFDMPSSGGAYVRQSDGSLKRED
ncbi:MAG: hypothetical protein V3V60_15970 [Sphingomonas aquatilis]